MLPRLMHVAFMPVLERRFSTHLIHTIVPCSMAKGSRVPENHRMCSAVTPQLGMQRIRVDRLIQLSRSTHTFMPIPESTLGSPSTQIEWPMRPHPLQIVRKGHQSCFECPDSPPTPFLCGKRWIRGSPFRGTTSVS